MHQSVLAHVPGGVRRGSLGNELGDYCSIYTWILTKPNQFIAWESWSSPLLGMILRNVSCGMIIREDDSFPFLKCNLLWDEVSSECPTILHHLKRIKISKENITSLQKLSGRTNRKNCTKTCTQYFFQRHSPTSPFLVATRLAQTSCANKAY